MSWSARGTKSTKNRILTIEKRTVNTTIPSLDSLFSTYVQEDHSNLAKNLIEQIYFSSFPDKDASATLSTLSINKYNIQNLKSSGSLGVIIEMLNRLEFSKSVDETFQDWNDHSENKKNKEITRGKSDDSLEGFHENQRVTRQDNHDDESVGGESTISHLTQPSYKSHQSKTSHTHHLRRSHGTSSTNIEEHVSDLINSISILTENDVDTCQRLLHHPNALINLLKLLKLSSGITQSKILLIIDKLCSTPHGMDTFLSHRIYTTLISYELLIRSSTLLHVRHHAAQLIHKLTNYNSKDFPILLLQDVILFDGECIVDGYIEVQLLNSIHSYLTYLSTENIPIPWCSAVMSHLINQIKDETFVDLEHLVLIVKCLMILSKDTEHCEFLLKNSLGISLQYIVRTDFELFRRVVDPSRSAALKHRRHPSSSSLPSSPAPSSFLSARSLSSSQSPTRTHTSSSSRHTQSPSSRKGNLTVNLVRDSINQVVSSKSIEDINFKLTRLVILIYENVLKLGIHVIGDIVSSGLMSGLLFRVGKGENIEKRFFKLVNHFIYLLLIKLCLTLDSSERSMAVIELAPPEVYTRGGNKSSDLGDLPGTSRRKHTISSSISSPSSPSSPAILTDITNKLVKDQSEPITIRTVTKKLHVQGVTELLIHSLDSDDYDVIRDSLVSLASLHFPTIKSLILVEKVLGRITGYTHTRRDCFYSGLALIADAINSPPSDHFQNFLQVMVSDFNVVTLLTKALKLSGWVFNKKQAIYDAMAVLSSHPKFRDKLRKSRGINITVYEMDSRRKQRAIRRLVEYDIEADASTDALYAVLKKDWAATKIQAVYRAFIARKRGYTSGGLLKIFFGSIGEK